MSRPKTTTKVRRPLSPGGLLHIFHSKADDLPAHLTREDDLEEGQPSLKVSRAFAIGLGLHVVAILGFMAFTMIRKSDTVKEANVSSTAPTKTTTPDNPPPPAPLHGAPGGDSQSQNTAANLAPQPASPATPAPAPSPDAAQPGVAVVGPEDPENQGLRYHLVQAGETVKVIAEMYGVEPRALAEKNDLISGKKPFEAGLRLIVPARQIAGTAPADPAEGAADNGASEAMPKDVEEPSTDTKTPSNVADNKPIRRAEPAGGKVSAPPKHFNEVTPPVAPKKETAKVEPKKVEKKPESSKTVARNDKPKETSSKGRVHIVAEGETAYRIAVNHKVDVDKLIKINKINPTALRPGTKLIIPGR